MKKLIMIVIGFAFLLTGCSVENITSKAEMFEVEAEELEQTVAIVKKQLNPLTKKVSLSQEDQKLMVSQIERVTAEINDFKELEAPMILAEKAKEMAFIQLNQRTEELKVIKARGENGEANTADIERIMELLSGDFDIHIFQK
jgi:PBP1b-binding outer membrane lipoprotein LpoB